VPARRAAQTQDGATAASYSDLEMQRPDEAHWYPVRQSSAESHVSRQIPDGVQWNGEQSLAGPPGTSGSLLATVINPTPMNAPSRKIAEAAANQAQLPRRLHDGELALGKAKRKPMLSGNRVFV